MQLCIKSSSTERCFIEKAGERMRRYNDHNKRIKVNISMLTCQYIVQFLSSTYAILMKFLVSNKR